MDSMINFKKVDKLVVHYAKLASLDLGAEFFVKVQKPFEFARPVHEYVRVGYMEMMDDPRGAIACLKRAILTSYYKVMEQGCNTADKEKYKALGLGWMWEINDVELVECHLLRPKEPVYDVDHALLVEQVADYCEGFEEEVNR